MKTLTKLDILLIIILLPASLVLALLFLPFVTRDFWWSFTKGLDK